MTAKSECIATIQAQLAASAPARAAEDAALQASHAQELADLQAKQGADVQALSEKRAAEDKALQDVIALISGFVPEGAELPPAPAAA